MRRFVRNFIYDNYGYIRHYWNWTSEADYTLKELADGISNNMEGNDYMEVDRKYGVNYNGLVFDRAEFDARKGRKGGKR